jgi:hypothetical protein
MILQHCFDGAAATFTPKPVAFARFGHDQNVLTSLNALQRISYCAIVLVSLFGYFVRRLQILGRNGIS